VIFTTVLCVVFSVLVSAVSVALRDRQVENRRLDKIKNVLTVAGLMEPGQKLPPEEISRLFEESLVPKIVDLETGDYVESDEPLGILSHAVQSDTLNHAYMLRMGKSYNPEHPNGDLYLKMDGHKVYQYALRAVPAVVRECIEKAGLTLRDIKKVFLHQANAKMDDAILARLFRLYGEKTVPVNVMPMTISWLGNSSVATLPTLFDLVVKGKLNDHGLESGDLIVFASVGAGMNINAVTYRMP
jgi:3-oxoacyl-[acyl-carrier-protein] synthase-3